MPLQTCCCGCLSLRGGSIAVGAALTSLNSLSVVSFLSALLYLLLERPEAAPMKVEVTAALLAVSALHLVFSGLLLHGARRGRRDLLLTWLIFTAIVVILQAMAVVVAVVLACMNHAGAVDSAILGAGAVWTGLLAYCFTVVLQYSLELNTLKTKQLNSGTAAKSGGGRGKMVSPVQTV